MHYAKSECKISCEKILCLHDELREFSNKLTLTDTLLRFIRCSKVSLVKPTKLEIMLSKKFSAKVKC